MAFDGITISNILFELKEKLIGARIDKIYQPEKDEIVLALRNNGTHYKLLLTANASYPRIHLTQNSKENPMNAPLFCMVLRKHFTSGKITGIQQPEMDRIVEITIDSYNELGDLTSKKLIFEIMGKHSNIMLVDANQCILDAIKHVSLDKSSVRPIFPGRTYTPPPSNGKQNPLTISFEDFAEIIQEHGNESIKNVLYKNLNGISPLVASELCALANVDEKSTPPDKSVIRLLFQTLHDVLDFAQTHHDVNQLIYDENGKLLEFTCFPMKIFEQNKKKSMDSFSALIEQYYIQKDQVFRLGQKSTDLKRLLENNMDRCKKKNDRFQQTLLEIAQRDTLKRNGELITANIYNIKKGDSVLTCQNFYEETLPEISIPLDTQRTPAENAQWYFKKYNKEKRTYEALQSQMVENETELLYLNTVITSLQSSTEEMDIREIRDELYQQGYLKKKKHQLNKKNERPQKTAPLHFKSSDGFDIYVGKNNKQNDELTLKFASNQDLWFHTKNIPGSHVIIKTDRKEVPNKTLEEAATLAVHYSQGKNGTNVPVDYTVKKNVRKPNGAKPGMVIYESNKTIYITLSDQFSLDDFQTVKP